MKKFFRIKNYERELKKGAYRLVRLVKDHSDDDQCYLFPFSGRENKLSYTISLVMAAVYDTADGYNFYMRPTRDAVALLKSDNPKVVNHLVRKMLWIRDNY